MNEPPSTPEVRVKTLWQKPPHPDNYIHIDHFLSSLRRNPNFRPYSYWPLVLLTFAVTQQLATIFLFLGIFVWLKDQRLDPRTSLFFSILCYASGYAVWLVASWVRVTSDTQKPGSHLRALKSSILVFFALMSLSPVLRTLTAATSSDSIWALSAILFGLNVLLADYRTTKHISQTQEHLSSVLSINAAVSASVVLASRLSSDTAVFALVLLSVQTFALFPMLRHKLRALPMPFQALWTLLLAMAAIWSAATISKVVTIIYTAILTFVTFIAPGLLMWAQKFKNEIRGPWDVAIPKVKTT
ncbi:phosphatidylinositol N-acetylglucosaminyltransferase [Pluteus cervinus]|uniref:Phosphatidylinositol N-acetylglucosaminyltransferase n=1 Tax=Pluteus cervinus TaxID=181527 RepID=A0ACD3BHH5_9AGAR|nr:phosphatidylinositol N-acetylglucosaminyltransferase [Pluteus cervinus]